MGLTVFEINDEIADRLDPERVVTIDYRRQRIEMNLIPVIAEVLRILEREGFVNLGPVDE